METPTVFVLNMLRKPNKRHHIIEIWCIRENLCLVSLYLIYIYT